MINFRKPHPLVPRLGDFDDLPILLLKCLLKYEKHLDVIRDELNYLMLHRKLWCNFYLNWCWHTEWLTPSHTYHHPLTHTETEWRCQYWSGCRWWYWIVCTDILRVRPPSEQGTEADRWRWNEFFYGHTILLSEIDW